MPNEGVRVASFGNIGAWTRALRPHQWAKNALVFLPLMTAHNFAADPLITATLSFIAFSLCASATYILNDLVDLPHDRQHAWKRTRPFASGALTVRSGFFAVPVLLVVAASVTIVLPQGFALVLLIYAALTVSYSYFLKSVAIVDVVVLGSLYVLRVIAGGAAVGVSLSAWLLGFSLFFFLALALIKRYAELSASSEKDDQFLPGRAYRTGDLPVVQTLAGGAAFAAALILALYLNGDTVVELYRHPQRLWLAVPLYVFWISRVLLLAHRGEMNEDPVVFALRDWVSLASAVALVGIGVSAI